MFSCAELGRLRFAHKFNWSNLRERKARALLLTCACLLLLNFMLSEDGSAQTPTRYFPETDRSLRGRFLEYWQTHGGLNQQGYPISDEMQERSDTDGRIYTVQYFERAVFEYHPENQPPYDVLLSLLGSFEFKNRYGRADQPACEIIANYSRGSVFFQPTGKRLGGVFLDYWRKNGGLDQQGYPVSDEFMERSELDGKMYKVQYFERAVFEYHPENEPPYDVLLSQLGTFRYKVKYSQALPVSQSSAGDTNNIVPREPLPTPASGTFNALSALAPDDVWAVGTDILHWDGTRWKRVADAGTLSFDKLWSVAAISSDDVWAVGAGRAGAGSIAVHWDGSAWSRVFVPAEGSLRSLAVVSSNDVWAVGAADYRPVILHWDGKQWNTVPTPRDLNDGQLEAVAAVSSNDVWAVGQGPVRNVGWGTLTLHWDGVSWSRVTSPNYGDDGRDYLPYMNHLRAVAALAPNNVWAVGEAIWAGDRFEDNALIVHWNGKEWSLVPGPAFRPGEGRHNIRLAAIVASAPDGVWAAGSDWGRQQPLIVHWNGQEWRVSTCAASADYGLEGSERVGPLYGVALTRNDLWVAGLGYQMRHDYSYSYTKGYIGRYSPCPCPLSIATYTPTMTPTATPTVIPGREAALVRDGDRLRLEAQGDGLAGSWWVGPNYVLVGWRSGTGSTKGLYFLIDVRAGTMRQVLVGKALEWVSPSPYGKRAILMWGRGNRGGEELGAALLDMESGELETIYSLGPSARQWTLPEDRRWEFGQVNAAVSAAWVTTDTVVLSLRPEVGGALSGYGRHLLVDVGVRRVRTLVERGQLAVFFKDGSLLMRRGGFSGPLLYYAPPYDAPITAMVGGVWSEAWTPSPDGVHAAWLETPPPPGDWSERLPYDYGKTPWPKPNAVVVWNRFTGQLDRYHIVDTHSERVATLRWRKSSRSLLYTGASSETPGEFGLTQLELNGRTSLLVRPPWKVNVHVYAEGNDDSLYYGISEGIGHPTQYSRRYADGQVEDLFTSSDTPYYFVDEVVVRIQGDITTIQDLATGVILRRAALPKVASLSPDFNWAYHWPSVSVLEILPIK